MKLGKVFKVFGKGAKAAGKRRRGKDAAAKGAYQWPSGVRIGVYGHFNAGKTVYFTVLNEECKVARDLQIAVTDNLTAGEFLSNYRKIWGVGTQVDSGTVVDLREDRKFPDPTPGDKILQFTAIIDRKKKVRVVSYDYPGRAISISEPDEHFEKVLDFVIGSDGLLFMFDPKVLGAELECQAHVSSFVNALEQLAPLRSRLPIPVGLVVTKADILPGFASDRQTILISSDDEHFLAGDFETFLERVLTSNRIASDSAWAGSVRNILVKMKEFLKIVIGRTLDFQIFFVSATGQQPEKIATDVGRSIYAPPTKMTPVGVKEPFYWILRSIRRSRSIALTRRIAKYVAVASLVWMIGFSLPYLWHFTWLLPGATNVEDRILEAYGGNRFNISRRERDNVIRAYSKYERAWTTRALFERFRVPANQIRERYSEIELGDAITELRRLIEQVTVVVSDSLLWPRPNPATDSLVLSPVHQEMEAALSGFHRGDETSVLYTQSGRVLTYWELFKNALMSSDTSAWGTIAEQVDHDAKLYSKERSREEIALGEALTAAVTSKLRQQIQTGTVVKAGTELDDLIAQIKANPDPTYRLRTAVTKLQDIRALLQGNPAREQDVRRIDAYLTQADYFDQRREYRFTLTSCPEDHHIHVLVKKGGKVGDWPIGQQLRMGDEFSITWRSGDHILIALDEKHVTVEETWGQDPKDLATLKSRYSIFDMDGTISFPSTGVSIGVSAAEDLLAKLPDF